MNQPTAPRPIDLAFSDGEFQMIAAHAARHYGLDIKIEKKGLIYARLARRIRALGMDSFKSYCALVTGHQAGAEREELLSALTTNVSSFFREKHHFAYLTDSVLPQLRKKLDSGAPVRIWSAGCSAGQEPYTIAATIRQAWPDADHRNVQIHASDVDPRILETAQAATYRTSETEGLPNQGAQMLFSPTSLRGDQRVIQPELRKMVTFERLNLIDRWSFATPFDAIFCRNVVIYFERATQHTLWRRFRDNLVPNGHLFIGHSERLTGPAAADFTNVGITTFIKSRSEHA